MDSNTVIEQTPISKKEYYAIQAIFGMMSELSRNLEDIKNRAQKLPGVWRDLKLCQTLLVKSQKLLLKTVPTNKLIQIRRELDHTYTRIHVGKDYSENTDTVTYIDREALNRIVGRAMLMNCFACTKCGKAARKCQLRQDIEDTYLWNLHPLRNDELCRFADCTLEEVVDEQENRTDSAS